MKNIWNMQSSKQRLWIRQRTQAHRKHLMNLLNIKSNLNDRIQINKKNSKQSNAKLKNKSLSKQFSINQQNNQIINKVETINLKTTKSLKSNRKFINLNKTLATVSTSQRLNNQTKINYQNSKLFKRLINTNSTLGRKFWLKNSQNIEKYKNNLRKCKYIKPDYTIEVAKQICQKRKTMKHLQINNSILPGISLRF